MTLSDLEIAVSHEYNDIGLFTEDQGMGSSQ